jgi:hypothetical protein
MKVDGAFFFVDFQLNYFTNRFAFHSKRKFWIWFCSALLKLISAFCINLLRFIEINIPITYWRTSSRAIRIFFACLTDTRNLVSSMKSESLMEYKWVASPSESHLIWYISILDQWIFPLKLLNDAFYPISIVVFLDFMLNSVFDLSLDCSTNFEALSINNLDASSKSRWNH